MTIKKQENASMEILNTREAADLLNVNPQTLKNYIYSGKLPALKTPGGHHRIKKSDLKNIGFIIKEEKPPLHFSSGELWEAYNGLAVTLDATVEAFVKALDTRQIISSGHSSRVADLACSVGKGMGLAEKQLRELRLAALFHDVGKVGISEAILGKPGRLTDQEYFMIKKHPEIGEIIVKEMKHLSPLASSVRHHHERFDGKGYPDKIGGSDIELKARIIAVAEAYDFLNSDLSFRRGFSNDDILGEIKNCSGTQFDPSVVKYFIDHKGENKSNNLLKTN